MARQKFERTHVIGTIGHVDHVLTVVPKEARRASRESVLCRASRPAITSTLLAAFMLWQPKAITSGHQVIIITRRL